MNRHDDPLAARWLSDDGRRRLAEALVAAREGRPWAAALIGFPRVEESPGGRDLRAADLSCRTLNWCNFYGADLRGAVLAGANLVGADLRRADLRGADLSGAYLAEAELGDARLAGASLRGAFLRDADLQGADLAEADLTGADLGASLAAESAR